MTILVDRPDYLRLLSRSARDLADALDKILRPRLDTCTGHSKFC